MFFRLGWLVLVLFPLPSIAILPLPYPIEPFDEELSLVQSDQRDPKLVKAFEDLQQGSKSREKELPVFEDQEDALGYEPAKTFQVPASLKPRVDFWIKIFSEYTSDQAVLHDAYYPEITYDVYDISHFTRDPSLSYRAQLRRINKFLKGEKSRIIEKLLFLHTNRYNPLTIPLEYFSLFRKFERVSDPDRFLHATQRIRTQIGQRDRLVRGFFFGGRYFDKMTDILREKKLPKELSRLPLVESSFDLSARSKVGASGIWQFMRSTGKRFLRIDRFVDERNDPVAATRAAAELLRQNYEVLVSWPLAITAYNHGRAGIREAMRVLTTNDLSVVIDKYQSRTFGFASANFYSEFLAVLEVEREYRKHFGKLMVDAPIVYKEFTVADNAMFDDLAGACGMHPVELALFNPALTDLVVSGRGYVPKGFNLKVDPNNLERCKSGYRNVSRVDPERWVAKER